MQKPLLLIATAIAMQLTAMAQHSTFEVTLGPVVKPKVYRWNCFVLGSDTNNLFVAQYETPTAKSIAFESVDPNVPVLKSIGRTDAKVAPYTTYVNAIKTDSGISVLTYLQDSKAGTGKLSMQRLNTGTTQPDGAATTILEVPEAKHDGGYWMADWDYRKPTRAGRNGFSIRYSSDSSKIVIHKLFPFEKNAAAKVCVAVYNRQMKELHKDVYTLQYNNELYQLLDYEVDDEGNVFSLGKSYERGRTEPQLESKNYKLHVVSYKKNSSEINELDVSQGDDKYIDEAELIVNKQGNVVVTGLYSTKNSSSSSGIFYTTINRTSFSIAESKLQDLPASVMPKKGELKFYNLDFAHVEDDGEIILIAQKVYTVQEDFNSFSSHPVTMHFKYYDGLLVTKLDASGQLLWSKIVAKHQRNRMPAPSDAYDYYPIFRKGEVHFIYNDSEKNIDLKEGDYPGLYFGINSMPVLVTLDSNGNMRRQLLPKTETTLSPIYSSKIDNDHYLLYGSKWKKHQFVKLSFK